MDLRLIATVKQGSQLVGLRVLDVRKRQIKDVPIKNIIQVIASGKVSIKGIKLDGGTGDVVGSNGSLDRYPVVEGRMLRGKSPLVILAQYIKEGEIAGYKVVDWKGTIARFRVDGVLDYASWQGIANGAIKNLGGRRFISSIVGEYDKIIMRPRVAMVTKGDIEKTVWSIEEFRDYMNKHKGSYSIKEGTKIDTDGSEHKELQVRIRSMDTKIIKYPYGVRDIEFDEESQLNWCAEVLIIPPTVKRINCRVIDRLKNLNRIVIQEGAEEIQFVDYMLTNDSVKELVFPNSLRRLSGGISGLKGLKTLDLENTILEECVDTLNSLEVEELRLPNTVKVIRGSFNCLENIKSVKFPESLEDIHDSFKELGVEEIDLTKCNKLTNIGFYAFNKCMQLRRVRLADSIEVLGCDVLSECTELSDVTFPYGLTILDSGVFRNCPIEKFVVTKNIERMGNACFSRKTVIEIEDGITDIGLRRIGSWAGEVILPDTVKRIKNTAFSYNSSLSNLRLPKNIEEIGRDAFRGCISLETVGIEHCNKLEVIGREAFRDSGLTRIILPEGLVQIEDGCFEGANKLRDVVLPRSLKKIGRRAFIKDGGMGMGITFYVYDKTMGYNFCRRNKLAHIIIEDIEEVYESLGLDRELSESKEAKIKLLLTGSEMHKVLLDEEFAANADRLLGIYNHLNGDITDKSIELNTSKLIEFPVSKIPVLDKAMDRLKREGELIKSSNTGISNNVFKCICNFITKITDLNTTPFTKLGLEYLKNECSLYFYTIYADENNIIGNFQVENKDGFDTNRTLITVVIMGEMLRYVTVLDRVLQDNEMSELQRLPEFRTKYENDKEPISQLLTVGDSLRIFKKFRHDHEENRIDGASLPEYIYDMAVNSVVNSLILVGRDSVVKKLGKVPDDNDSQRFGILLDLLCMETSKVITVYAYYRSRFNDISAVKHIRNIEIMDIIGVSDLEGAEDDVMSRITRGMTSDRAKRLYLERTMPDYLNQLRKIPGAYDIEACKEWKLAQMLKKHAIDNIEDLNKETFRSVMDTALFCGTRRKIGEDNSYKVGENELCDGSIITEVELDDPVKVDKIPYKKAKYAVMLRDGDRIHSYLMYDTFEKSLDKFIKMRRHIEDPLMLTDNIYSQDEFEERFVSIYNSSSMYYGDELRCKVHIAISRNNGGVYVIGNRFKYNRVLTEYDLYYCELLRMKNLDKAIKHIDNICRMWDGSGVHKSVCSMTDVLVKTRTDDSSLEFMSGDLSKMREAIMNGVPNLHYMSVEYLDLWDDLAKQPKV